MACPLLASCRTRACWPGGSSVRSLAGGICGPPRWMVWWRGWGGISSYYWLDCCPDKTIGNGPYARSQKLARLEAVLFLSRQPLASRRLAQLADLADGTEARTLVRLLNRLYDGRGSAFRVEEVAGGFRLLTRAKFAPWLGRRHPMGVQLRLCGPALETLAVVAYRQPVMRADIEAIRGVQCDEVLRQLIEMDLVRVVGRAEELGRPLLYGTTRRFLEVFGLRHLEELPPLASEGGYCPAGEDAAAEAQSNQQLHSSQTVGEESNVKVLSVSDVLVEESVDMQLSRAAEHTQPDCPAGPTAYHDEEDEDFEDEDFEDEDELDEDEDDLEEDEDFEDEDWEEVEDEDEEEEDEEDEEDWDDDWDEEDEDEDWDEEEEDDWEEDEEEED